MSIDKPDRADVPKGPHASPPADHVHKPNDPVQQAIARRTGGDSEQDTAGERRHGSADPHREAVHEYERRVPPPRTETDLPAAGPLNDPDLDEDGLPKQDAPGERPWARGVHTDD